MRLQLYRLHHCAAQSDPQHMEQHMEFQHTEFQDMEFQHMELIGHFLLQHLRDIMQPDFAVSISC